MFLNFNNKISALGKYSFKSKNLLFTPKFLRRYFITKNNMEKRQIIIMTSIDAFVNMMLLIQKEMMNFKYNLKIKIFLKSYTYLELSY